MNKNNLMFGPMSEDLRRQRKSLIIVNLILFFMKYTDVKISKINLLGAEISIANINAIYLLLWVMWIYFLVRFYNQYRFEGLSLLNKAWENSRDHTIIKIREFIQRQPDFEEFDKNIKHSEIKRKGDKFVVRVQKPETRDSEDLVIPFFVIWKYRIKTANYFLRNHTIFFDYKFPLALSGITLVYCNISRWQGDILTSLGF